MSRYDGVAECLSKFRCQRWAITSLMLNSTKGWTSTDISSCCECGVRLISTCRMAMDTPTRHRHCGSRHDLERGRSFRLESLHFSIEFKSLLLGPLGDPSYQYQQISSASTRPSDDVSLKVGSCDARSSGGMKLVILSQPFLGHHSSRLVPFRSSSYTSTF